MSWTTFSYWFEIEEFQRLGTSLSWPWAFTQTFREPSTSSGLLREATGCSPWVEQSWGQGLCLRWIRTYSHYPWKLWTGHLLFRASTEYSKVRIFSFHSSLMLLRFFFFLFPMRSCNFWKDVFLLVLLKQKLPTHSVFCLCTHFEITKVLIPNYSAILSFMKFIILYWKTQAFQYVKCSSVTDHNYIFF